MGCLLDALAHVYNVLGFGPATGGDEVFFQLVAARVIESVSKLDSLRVLEEAGLAAVSYPTVNRRLPVYARDSWRQRYLLSTSDPKLNAEDIALGYKQLLEVERGWRDLKQVIDLRPVYHRKEERIRAHVILCWLALLLIRVAETAASSTWARIADEMEMLTLGTFTGSAGTYSQTAELTKTQRDILAKLKLAPPKKIIEATPAAS